MKPLFVGALLIGATAIQTPAQVLLNYAWTTFDGAPSITIPDANATGVADTRSILDEAWEIISVTLNLEVAGNFNGDLYVTLQHSSGFSVIMNRPGRGAGNAFGYDDRGFNVSFSDTARNGDVHSYRETSAPLTGAWQPDGRLIDPVMSLTSSPRTAFLSSFAGQSMAGEWTLFAADLSPGGESHILAWGLQVTVVPEPREMAFVTALGLLSFAFLSRRIEHPCGLRHRR